MRQVSNQMKSIQNQEQKTYQNKLDDKMRIFANLLIDRFLEDMKNNRLQCILRQININSDGKENHGTI